MVSNFFFHKCNFCRFFPINFTLLFTFLYNYFWRLDFFSKISYKVSFSITISFIKPSHTFSFSKDCFLFNFHKKMPHDEEIMVFKKMIYQNIVTIYKQDNPSNCKHLQNKIVIFLFSFTIMQNYKINFGVCIYSP